VDIGEPATDRAQRDRVEAKQSAVGLDDLDMIEARHSDDRGPGDLLRETHEVARGDLCNALLERIRAMGRANIARQERAVGEALPDMAMLAERDDHA